MGWRFSRRIRIFPGVRLNLSRRGASVSIGGRGARYTAGHGRRRLTVGVPGTGVSYTKSVPAGPAPAVLGPNRSNSATAVIVAVALAAAIVVTVIVLRWLR